MCATHSHIDFDGVVGVRHELAETFLRPYRIAFNTLTVHLAVTEPQVVSIIVVSVRRPGNASGEQTTASIAAVTPRKSFLNLPMLMCESFHVESLNVFFGRYE